MFLSSFLPIKTIMKKRRKRILKKAKFFLQQDSYQTYPNNRPQNQVVCFRLFDTAVLPNSYCFDVSMYTWNVSNAFSASVTIQLTIVPWTLWVKQFLKNHPHAHVHGRNSLNFQPTTMKLHNFVNEASSHMSTRNVFFVDTPISR